MSPESSFPGESRLNELIAAYLQAEEAGQTPGRQELLRQHPDLEEALRAFFADHDRMHQAVAPHRPVAPHEAPTLAPGEGSPVVPTRIRYFGDYELLDEIARGGMGVVFRARQVSLNRIVAVKMILAGQLAGPAEVERFKTEAEAAANLDHPHILPIYEVGEFLGQQYFSMKLIEGQSLAQQPRTAVRGLVEVMVKVARAVHYAHQRGLLHRDLKPANILVDRDGTPFVTDFGLAKRVEGDRGLTQSGVIVGTPGYMPPEQARAEKVLTTAIDVYALGAILYELLTGQPPFRGQTPLDTILQVLDRDPPHPHTLNRAADPDLATIALKCLQKDARQRYGSAEALAEDLERWLRGEPIVARPVSALERTWKWARRRPAIAALLAVSAAALLALVGALAVSKSLLAQKHEETTQALQREEATSQQLQTTLDRLSNQEKQTRSAFQAERRSSYGSGLALAASEWNANNPTAALRHLDSCPVDLRGWEWHHLQHVAHAEQRQLVGHVGFAGLETFSPDGKRLLTCGMDSSVRIWDVTTGQQLRDFRRHRSVPGCAAFHPNGRMVASGSVIPFRVGDVQQQLPTEILLWDSATGQVHRTLGTDQKGIVAVAFAPDGKLLASLGADYSVSLWSVATGQEVHRWTASASETIPVLSIAFSADGHKLAVVKLEGVVLWDTTTHEELRRLRGEWGAAFSPDGKKLATVRNARLVTIWDAAGEKPLFNFIPRTAPVTCLAFDPTGQHLAIGGGDGIVEVWDLESQKERDVFRGEDGWILGVAYSPDGKYLATAGGDVMAEVANRFVGRAAPVMHLRLWDASQGQDFLRRPYFGGHPVPHPTRPHVFFANGKEVRLLDFTDGMSERHFFTAPENVTRPAISRDGTVIAVGWLTRDSTALSIELFDGETGKRRGSFSVGPPFLGALTLSPDGKRLVLSGWGKPFRVFDTTTGKEIAHLEGADGGATHLAFTDDGRLLRATTSMTMGSDTGTTYTPGIVEIWDLERRQILGTLPGLTEECHGLAVSPDGRLAAVMGKVVRLFRLDEAEPPRVVPAAAYAFAFSPDGSRLATATAAGLKLWDAISGRELVTLAGGKPMMVSGEPVGSGRLAWTADGRYLLATESGSLRIYDGGPWVPPPSPREPASAPLPPPPTDLSPDLRPDAVRQAVRASIDALEKQQPGATLAAAVAALKAEPDATRQRLHRIRIALALQELPKLRPIMKNGAVTEFVRDLVPTLPTTADVMDPLHVVGQIYTGDLVRLSGDGKRIAVWNVHYIEEEAAELKARGRSPFQLRVYDAWSGKPVGPPLDLGQVRSSPLRVALNQDGSRIAVALHAGHSAPQNGHHEWADVVRVWDVATGMQLGPDLPLYALLSESWDLRLRFLGERVLVASQRSVEDQRWAVAWDLTSGTALETPQPHNFVGGDARHLITAWDGPAATGLNAYVWDAVSLKPVGVPMPVEGVTAAAVSEDGTRAVIAHGFWVSAWDVTRGCRLHADVQLPSKASQVAITQDGTSYAVCCGVQSANIQVRDTGTGRSRFAPISLSEGEAYLCKLQFCADDRILLTVTYSEARLWDARTGEPLTRSFTGMHDGSHPVDAVVAGESFLVRYGSNVGLYELRSLAPDERPVVELEDLVSALNDAEKEGRDLLELRRHLLAAHPEYFGPPVSGAGEVRKESPDLRPARLASILSDRMRPAWQRLHAAQELAGVATAAQRPALLAALGSDPDAGVRAAAAKSLGDRGEAVAEVDEALQTALRGDKEAAVRAAAARALRGAAARSAVPDLAQALKTDADATVRAAAAFALGGAVAEQPGAVAALREALKAAPPSVRVEAAGALARLLREPREAVVILAEYLAHPDTHEAYVAVHYLDQLGPRAAAAVPALTKLVGEYHLQRNTIDITLRAVNALGHVGPEAHDAVGVLIVRLGDEEVKGFESFNIWNKQPASLALAQIGPVARPALEKALREEKDTARRAGAARALGYMGPGAKESISVLEVVRKTAEGPLGTILDQAIARIRDPKTPTADQVK